METKMLYELPIILFQQFLTGLGISSEKKVIFSPIGTHCEYVCRWAFLPKTSNFEEPTLLLVDYRDPKHYITKVSIYLLTSHPKINLSVKIESLNIHSKIEAKAESYAERPMNSGSFETSIGLNAHMVYLGVIEVDNLFNKLSNLYSLELTKKAYELYYDGHYNWVNLYKKTGAEIKPLSFVNAGIETEFTEEQDFPLKTGEELEKILDLPITELDVSVRTLNTLMVADFKTIRDIVGCTENDLLKFRGFKHKALQDLQKRLHAKGLKLVE